MVEEELAKAQTAVQMYEKENKIGFTKVPDKSLPQFN